MDLMQIAQLPKLLIGGELTVLKCERSVCYYILI